MVSFLTKFILGGLEIRNKAWVVPEVLCSLRWCVGVFSTFKESSIINF